MDPEDSEFSLNQILKIIDHRYSKIVPYRYFQITYNVLLQMNLLLLLLLSMKILITNRDSIAVLFLLQKSDLAISD